MRRAANRETNGVRGSRTGRRPPPVRVAAVVLANALQVGATWWVLREAAAATARRRGGLGPIPHRAPAQDGALRVAVLVLANAAQVLAIWWFHREHVADR
jgi:hypothetical protein